MFAVMDLTNEVGAGIISQTETLMSKLCRKCFSEGPWDINEPEGAEDKKETEFGAVLRALAAELSSPNKAVRKQVRAGDCHVY